MFPFLLHIIAKLKIAFLYPEIWAIPSNPGVFTAHLFPFTSPESPRKEIQEEKRSVGTNNPIWK